MNRPLTRRRLLRTGVAAAGVATVAGCNILPGSGPAPDLYRLTPKSTFPDELPKVDWQLVLATPEADASLDTTRIALMRQATRVEYYADVSWTDRATLMVQTLILESFENSGSIVSVGRRALGLRADFELRTELREFQAEYFTGSINAHVAVNARLVEQKYRTIVAQQNFEGLAPVAEDAVPAAVEGFDQALGSVLKRLVGWTISAGQANYKP